MRSSKSAILAATLLCLLAISGMSSTQHRGINASLMSLTPSDLDLLVSWGVNLIRVNVGQPAECAQFAGRENGYRLLERALEQLDWVFEECEERGIRLIIDLHRVPDLCPVGDEGYPCQWQNPQLLAFLEDFWDRMASRYSSRGEVLYGYELLNEPFDIDTKSWLDVVERLISTIRKKDAKHAIIVDSVHWADPLFFKDLAPATDPNVIYSFHFYEWSEIDGLEYPSNSCSLQHMEQMLSAVREFQLRYAARILVGEVGIVSWTPEAIRVGCIQQILDLFERYGFDYTWWTAERAKRSLEHRGTTIDGESFGNYVGTTESLEVLLSFFQLNEQVSVAPIRGEAPICLFDEAHWWIDPEDNAKVRDIAWLLSRRFEIRILDTGTITGELLEDIDLLVTGPPRGRAYTSREIHEVHSYTSRGGALLVIGNENLPTSSLISLNRLLLPYGVQMHRAPLATDPVLSAWGEPHGVRIAAESVAVPGLELVQGDLTLSWSTSIETTEPAVPIITSTEETWQDINRDGQRDFAEPSCPCSIAAVSEEDGGRVAVVADNSWRDPCNRFILNGVIEWMVPDLSP